MNENLSIAHFLLLRSNFPLDNSSNDHIKDVNPQTCWDVSPLQVWPQLIAGRYFSPCFCLAEVSIVLRGKLCCWEVHSNWIVDKTSLSSALALLLMQVNNHLNGSCLCGDWKTGGKKERAAGVQHLNVNNLFFNACPAFRESETC